MALYLSDFVGIDLKRLGSFKLIDGVTSWRLLCKLRMTNTRYKRAGRAGRNSIYLKTGSRKGEGLSIDVDDGGAGLESFRDGH